MMNVEEAGNSLGSYADQLELGCDLHRLAVSVAAKSEAAGPIKQQATGFLNKTVSELRRLQQDATIFCILVAEGVVEEADQFVRRPDDYTKVSQAKDRVIGLLQQAGTLVQEHDRREAKNNPSPKESETVCGVTTIPGNVGIGATAELIESTANHQSDEI